VALFCLFFVIGGLVLVPYPGLQNDEVLFGSVIYEPRHLDDSVQVFKRKIPLMLMNYLGTLKSLFYAGLFKIWPPSPWSVRLPVILAGAATVWLFFLLLRDTLGYRAAVVGAVLLATDTTFLLTTTFDWGPVALQHLLLLGGVVLLVRFRRAADVAGGAARHPERLLAGAFFLFGLGLWDKVIFAWMLGGLGVALIVVFPRELSRLFTLRRLATAFVALGVGAAPLIVYNFRHHGPTFRSARYSAEHLMPKAEFFRSVLNGSSLFEYLVHEDTGRFRPQPPEALERASLALSEAAGRPRTNLMVPAVLISVALLVWLWTTPARPAIVFSAVAMLVAWIQMALIREAGGSAHHLVLLWPFPHLVIAAALAAGSHRLRRAGIPVLAALLAVLCAANVLVSNEHLAGLIRHGGGPVWTDAIYPLSAELEKRPAQRVIVIDWGIVDALRVLNRGRLPLYQAMDLASTGSLDSGQQQTLKWMLTLAGGVFVGHTPDSEAIERARARFRAHAERAGFREKVLGVVHDRHGRPVFELFCYQPAERATSVPGRSS